MSYKVVLDVVPLTATTGPPRVNVPSSWLQKGIETERQRERERERRDRLHAQSSISLSYTCPLPLLLLLLSLALLVWYLDNCDSLSKPLPSGDRSGSLPPTHNVAISFAGALSISSHTSHIISFSFFSFALYNTLHSLSH